MQSVLGWVELCVLPGAGQAGTSAAPALQPWTWEPALCTSCRVKAEKAASLKLTQNVTLPCKS